MASVAADVTVAPEASTTIVFSGGSPAFFESLVVYAYFATIASVAGLRIYPGAW